MIAAVLAMLVLDLCWINANKHMYASMVQKVQSKAMRVSGVPALLAYVLMILGLVWFVLPAAQKDSSKSVVMKALKYGAMFGLITYGIFNATNAALFSDYSLRVALVDTLWGMFVYFSAVILHLVL